MVQAELKRAQSAHDPMSSAHEGYAVLQEEVDELWAEIKADRGTSHRGVSEAVQIAAMALRYLIDLCDGQSAAQHDRKVEGWLAPNDRSTYGYSG